MAQPQVYQKTTNFTQVGSVTPNALDVELANVATSLNATSANLGLIQRDDGKLRDGSVDIATLSPSALANLSTVVNGYLTTAQAEANIAIGAATTANNSAVAANSSAVASEVSHQATVTLQAAVAANVTTATNAAASAVASSAVLTRVCNPRGSWTTATAYAINDCVIVGSIAYFAPVAHTSATWEADLAARNWQVLQGLTLAQLQSLLNIPATVSDGITNDAPALRSAILATPQAGVVTLMSPTYVGTSRIANIDGVQLKGAPVIYTDQPSSGSRVQNNSGRTADKTVWGQEYLFKLIGKVSLGKPCSIRLTGDSTANLLAGALYPMLSKIPSISFGFQTNPGYHTGQWLSTFLAADIAAAPDLLIWHWGMNDIPLLSRTLLQFEADLRAGLTAYRAAIPITAGGILLMTPNAASTSRDELMFEKMRLIIKNAAEDFQCAFFDTYAKYQDGYIGLNDWLDAAGVHPQIGFNDVIAGDLYDFILPSGIQKVNVSGISPTIADPSQGIRLSGAGTGISVANATFLNQGTGNFSVNWKGFLPKWKAAALPAITLLKKHDGVNGWALSVVWDGYTSNLQFTLGGVNYIPQKVAGPIADNESQEITVCVTRETATVAGAVSFYRNGVPIAYGQAITAAVPATVTNAQPLYLMGDAARQSSGMVQAARIYNRSMSPSEVFYLYKNGVAPLDIGASLAIVQNTIALRNLNMTSFVGNGATGLTATSNGTGVQVCGTGAEIATNAGKYINVQFDIVVASGAGPTVQIETALGSGSFLSGLSSTPATTGHFSLNFPCNANSTTGVVCFTNYLTASNYTITNLIVTQLTGCVIDLNSTGIQDEKWFDASGNNFSASYPALGYTLNNLSRIKNYQSVPIAYVNPSVALAAGDLLNGIITSTTAAGTASSYTLPTYASLAACLPSSITGSFYDWVLINQNIATTDTVTIAATTGHTITGSAIINGGTSARFRTIKNATSFITYRV